MQILVALARWAATASLTLGAIAYLTLLGLTLAQRAREGLPADPAGAALNSLAELASYLFSHPASYLWHRAETPAFDVVSGVFANSAGLLLVSLALAALVGIPLGIAAANARGRFGSSLFVLISVLGISTPSFLLAMFLWIVDIAIFRRTEVLAFPPTGFGWDLHMVMPAMVLAGRPIAQLARVTHVSFSEILGQDYIRTARGKGLPWRAVLSRHVFRNAIIPILTTLGISLRFSLASLPVVETFFLWPGVGATLLQMLDSGMDTLVTDLIVSLGLFFLLVNLLIDLTFPLLDARLREISLQESREGRRSIAELLSSGLDAIAGVFRLVFTRIASLNVRRSRPAKRSRDAAAGTSLGELPAVASARSKGVYVVLGNPALVVGAVLVGGLVLLAFLGDQFTDVSPYETHGVRMIEGVIQAPPFEPSSSFPWGSDLVGRDVRALMLVGARQTMILAFVAMVARTAVGAVIGTLAGWWKDGWFDRLLSGVIGVWAAFPVTLFAMVLIYALGIQQGMGVFILGLCIVGWGELAQSVRGKVAAIRAEPYIESARSLGAGTMHILMRSVLPNLAPSLIVLSVLEMSAVLMLLAELGFINVFMGGGFQAMIGEAGRMEPVIWHYSDVPEWGAMLASVRAFWRSNPWLGWYPGMAFFIAILSFNLLGEGMRRLLDDIHFAVGKIVNRWSLSAAGGLVVGIVLVMQSTTPLAVYSEDAARFDTARAMDDAIALSAPIFQGRETGTPGAKAAADYIAARMLEIGLFPTGEGGSFIQTLVNPRPHQIAVPRLEVIAPDGSVLHAFGYHADFAEEVEAAYYGEFVGPVIGCPLPEKSETSYIEHVTDRYDPQEVLLLRDGHQAEKGLARMPALLVVTDDAAKLQRRHLYGETTIYIRRGTVSMYISSNAATTLCQLVGSTSPDSPSALSIRMSIPVAEQSSDLRSVEHYDDVYYNVIGHIPGSGAIEGLDSQVIMVTAYYDGLGVDPQGVFYPGANDNASGVAAMLEIARLLKTTSYAPEKTVMFVAWAGGERHEGFSPVTVLNAKAGFASLTVEAILEISGVAGGWGEGIALGQGTSFRLVQLIQDAAKRFGVPVTTRGRGPHFWEGEAIGFGGRRALSAFISWDGSDDVAHTPYDTADRLDATKLGNLGGVVTLTTLVLSRETTY